jgi:histone H3/H4
VLDSISTLARKLKEAETISLAYLREFAFAPIARLLRRFGPAAIGLAAAAAKEALKDWLKKKGIVLFDDLF